MIIVLLLGSCAFFLLLEIGVEAGRVFRNFHMGIFMFAVRHFHYCFLPILRGLPSLKVGIRSKSGHIDLYLEQTSVGRKSFGRVVLQGCSSDLIPRNTERCCAIGNSLIRSGKPDLSQN